MPTKKIAVVTGGSSGIGAALVQRWRLRGYEVVAADFDPQDDAVFVDVRDFDGCHQLMSEVIERYGRVDIVALNAGVNSRLRPGDPLDLLAYRGHLAVELDGVVFGIDAAVRGFRGRGGAIVVTGSLSALAPEVSNPLYSLAKSAVLGYVRAMSTPLWAHGITVNAVCPGLVDTPLLADRRARLVTQGFPLLSPDDVAVAMESAVDSGMTGKAWAVIAGRAPFVYEYPEVPPALLPSGRPAPSPA